MPDPVSVSVDDQGRVFASQTKRRKIQDLDIREHSAWIPDDVGLTSVEEKSMFLKNKLAIGGDQTEQQRHVKDENGDGEFDWRDLMVVSEVIYRLVDRDQDGQADELTTFADGFNTEVTGIAAGVLATDGSVWATIAPDVWKLTDTDDDGVADTREVVAHGFGLHIAYAGHDLHGLTAGPDGKIYWSIGDKGINVTTKDGQHFFFPNQGGVMRCNPDGSDFEVFAHGLRNVQELAFDQYGNMFSVDNDSDQPSEKERFVYIVNGMDAGWRCNYQYRGENYNPWVDEKLWELPSQNHPAYIVPPLSHYVDGPAGFVYNPGTALSPEYYDHFFLTSAPNGQQYAFRIEPEGDAFRMVDEHQIGSGIAIVGWNFGPDGGLYGADWDGGYPLDQKGSIIRIDAPGADTQIREEVRALLRTGLKGYSTEELARLLAHQDQRVRLHAQFELVNRGEFGKLREFATNLELNPVTRLHALWGLGQLSRAGDAKATDVISSLFADDDYRVRGQAVKTFGELREVDSQIAMPLLDDVNPYVRTLAAVALARHPTPVAVADLLRHVSRIEPQQHYLRHSHSWALSQCATSEQLAEPANRDANEMQRMCCVIALRHQRSPMVASYLHDPSDWIATEAAMAIHDDFSVPSALASLAESLNTRQSQTEAFARRAINASFRDGSAKAATRVAEYASDSARSIALRLEAIHTLADWNDTAALDRVDGRNRHLKARKLDPHAVESFLLELVQSGDADLRAASVEAASSVGVALPDSLLVELVHDKKLSDRLRAAALKSLSEGRSYRKLAEVAQHALEDRDSDTLRKQAAIVLCRVEPKTGVRLAHAVIRDATEDMELRQTCIRALANIDGSEVVLRGLFEKLLSGELDRSLGLDLLQTMKLDERLRDEVDASLDLYEYARDGGNEQNGLTLFRTHTQAQCSRCHRTGRSGSEIGPELTEIGKKRDADYILRSIMQPSADIDEKYRTQLFVLGSGEVLKGVLLERTDEETTIADSNGNEITILNENIEQTKVQTVSLMPEMREVLSANEVRDLVAYLRSLTGAN